MNATIKTLAKDLLPPLLQRCLRTLGGGSKWKGNYHDWASAVAASSGYDDGGIFERVLVAARAVRDGEALWERDSVCFHHEEYNWHLIACLLIVAAQSGGKLHVLDFGGALGSTYMQHRKLLDGLLGCSWNVVEQPHFVKSGNEEIANDQLHFYESIDKCLQTQQINTILLSSVIQYIEQPHELIDNIIKHRFNFVIIDRTPFLLHGNDKITIQKVHPLIYKATYPSWFFNKNNFIKHFTSNYELITEFNSPDKANIRSIFKGFIFKLK